MAAAQWENDEPRVLTDAEIASIVDSLRFSMGEHTPIQENLLNIHKDKTRKKLSTVKVRPSKLPDLKRIIQQRFYSSIVAQGEAVGVNAAQCIGEPTTQSTLNTFHHTGQSAKNVTLGFPRAKELFNATHTPSNPTCTMYFTTANKSPKTLHKITDKIPAATINGLIKRWDIFEPVEYELEYWHTAWFKLHPDFEVSDADWCLRLKFNIAKLYSHNLKLVEIAEYIEKTYEDARCIPSPLNIGTIDVLVNCSEITITGERSGELMNIADDWEAKRFYMDKIVSPKIRGEQVCGIENITRIYFRKVKPNESFGGFPLKKEIAARITSEEEWIVDTDGTNLAEILAVDGIDAERTISNDMWEIFTLFGIEAVRMYLFNEFMGIVTGGGSSINPIHIHTLVSKMTYTGGVRSIARFGIETSQYDAIARATFEEVMSQLITSAVFSETDRLKGISSNIVLGTKIRAGTGVAQLENIALNVVPQPMKTTYSSVNEEDED